MKKVIYFTAAAVPTGAELTAIAALQTREAPVMEVHVRNGQGSQDMGVGVEAADFVAGTRPSAYSSTVTYPAPPAGLGGANGTTQAVVANAGTQAGITMTGTAGAGKTATFTVVAGVITAIAFA